MSINRPVHVLSTEYMLQKQNMKQERYLQCSGNYKIGSDDQLITMAHKLFVNMMAVTPLRVQDVSIAYDNYFVYVSAKLLDNSPFPGKCIRINM